MTSMIRSMLIAASVMAAAVTPAAQAAYPERPLTLINPYAAGGPADVVARSLGRALEKSLGQPVVVENKPGGGASIGLSLIHI